VALRLRRRSETFRGAGRAADGGESLDARRRNPGILWRKSNRARPVHPAGGVSAERRDGGGLLPCARAARVFPDREPRRAGGALLLHLFVHRHAGRRPAEPRCRRARQRRVAKTCPKSPRFLAGGLAKTISSPISRDRNDKLEFQVIQRTRDRAQRTKDN